MKKLIFIFLLFIINILLMAEEMPQHSLIKEGQICNEYQCEKGLMCSFLLKPKEEPFCKQGMLECKDNKDCCSGICNTNPVLKKKVCDIPRYCLRPHQLGESCIDAPVCAQGSCTLYNARTLGIGECSEKGAKCKTFKECCSNLCQNNKCVDSYLCKNCVPSGKKLESGQNCCEGLIPNKDLQCIPDLPPLLLPQVNNKSMFKMFTTSLSFFFFNTSYAQANINAVSAQSKNVVEAIDLGAIASTKKSNFDTCDIKMQEDYLLSITDQDRQNELQLLAFEFVAGGTNGTQDYFNFNQAFKDIADANKLKREHLAVNLDVASKNVTCACLDSKGYLNITDAAKKTFFEQSCHQYQDYLRTNGQNLSSGTASGLKAVDVLINYTSEMQNVMASTLAENATLYTKFADLNTIINTRIQTDSTTMVDQYVGNYSSSCQMGGVFGQIVSAATNIANSVTTPVLYLLGLLSGGGGAINGPVGYSPTPVISSIGRGAWLNGNKAPYFIDQDVGTSSCNINFFLKGSKHNFNRMLRQPINTECVLNGVNPHFSRLGCVKNFVAYQSGSIDSYVVDPWIPKNVSSPTLLRSVWSSGTHAEKLELGYNAVLPSAPATIGMTPDQAMLQVLPQYLSFFDSSMVTYSLTTPAIEEIKTKAKEFIVAEKLMGPNDVVQLDAFANYAFTEHFLWPKMSSMGSVEVPLTTLKSYVYFMAHGAASLLVGNIDSTTMYGQRLMQYTDYKATLLGGVYNTEGKGLSNLTRPPATVGNNAIDSSRLFNSLLSNKALSKDLINLDPSFIKKTADNIGVNSNTKLSKNQVAALNAIGKLRELRLTQEKQLQDYNKAMEKFSTPERIKKVNSSVASFVKKFEGPVPTLSSRDHGATASLAPTHKSYKIKEKSAPLLPLAVETEVSSGKDSVNVPVKNNEMSLLNEAIKARNEENQSKYSTSDGKSLFEIITNAYIRNYDRVLIKKGEKN